MLTRTLALVANSDTPVSIGFAPHGFRLVSGPGSVTLEMPDQFKYGPYVQRTKVFFNRYQTDQNFNFSAIANASVSGTYKFEFYEDGENVETEPTVQVNIGDVQTTVIAGAATATEYDIQLNGAAWVRVCAEGFTDEVKVQMKVGDAILGVYKVYAPDVFDSTGAKCAYDGLTASNLPENSIIPGQGLYWMLCPGAITITVTHTTTNVNLVIQTIAFGAGPWGFVTK